MRKCLETLQFLITTAHLFLDFKAISALCTWVLVQSTELFVNLDACRWPHNPNPPMRQLVVPA